MASLVDDEMLQETAALAAVGAAVRFLPGVNHLMLLQIVSVAEGLGAQGALEGFLSCVGVLVRHQRHLDPEAL